MIKRDSLFFSSSVFLVREIGASPGFARARARVLLAHFDQRPDDFPFSRGPSNRFRGVISRVAAEWKPHADFTADISG